MKSAENIKQLIKRLNITARPELHDRVLGNLLKTMEESVKKPSAITGPSLWRIIMKSRITRLATAAAVIIAITTGFIVSIGNGAKCAYAIEQTIEANHALRYLHIKHFKIGEDEPKEFWIKLNENEQIEIFRVDIPAWDSPSEGPKAFVWKDNKIEGWLKKYNKRVIFKPDVPFNSELHRMVKECDSREVVDRLYQLQAEGKVEMEFDEPVSEDEPIVITATYLPESDSPGQILILYIDQVTKLVMSIELHNQKDNEYLERIEYCDYKEPIDDEVFVLSEVPDDALVFDTTQDIGMAQGELSDKEIVVEVVSEFFRCLIDRDYVKAGSLWPGQMNAEMLEKWMAQIKSIRIISMGEPTEQTIPNRRRKLFSILCTIEFGKDGSIVERHKVYQVGQLMGEPDRWVIESGDNAK